MDIPRLVGFVLRKVGTRYGILCNLSASQNCYSCSFQDIFWCFSLFIAPAHNLNTVNQGTGALKMPICGNNA